MDLLLRLASWTLLIGFGLIVLVWLACCVLAGYAERFTEED